MKKQPLKETRPRVKTVPGNSIPFVVFRKPLRQKPLSIHLRPLDRRMLLCVQHGMLYMYTRRYEITKKLKMRV